ncbi:MAG: hypothetical protein FWF41_05565 [Betaproteobacteria bacterium]|nr:hypothetical protein [Betaproteobacteria bacterium]
MIRTRYQLLRQGGVYDYDTGQTLKLGDPGWDEYQAWLSAGNKALAPADKIPTLDEARANIKSAISDIAASLRNKTTLGISPAEIMAWTYKFLEAEKIVGYGAQTTLANIKASNPRIWEEAEYRGIDARDLAKKIWQKGSAFYKMEAAIAGISGKHSDAVDALADVRDVLFYDWLSGWPEV